MGNTIALPLKKVILLFLINGFIGGIIVALFFLITPFFKQGISKVNLSNSDFTTKKIIIENSSNLISDIAEKVTPSVVGISVTYNSEGLFSQNQNTVIEGSGVIIKENGYIITNFHVIEYAIKSGKIEVTLQDNPNKKIKGKIIFKNQAYDLAIIKINKDNLPTIKLGDSNKLQVGETVLAVGNPNGIAYMGSVTVGVISGLNRDISLSPTKKAYFIQTDAAISPGNSGGALVNMQGHLIGINTSKIGNTDFEGIGFSIPINVSADLIQQTKDY